MLAPKPAGAALVMIDRRMTTSVVCSVDPNHYPPQAYCRSKNLPPELEKRGVSFIDSKHRSQQIIDARATVEDMPPSLQDDIFWASESDD